MTENSKDDSVREKTSEIKFYSLGIAAANIEFGQKELEVTPIEDLSQLDGELTDVQMVVESTGVDREGNTYSTSETASNSINATWMPLDIYRPFPGLIRRGERVMIWRVGDTDKYYWTELGLDNFTRRKDIYTIFIPNSPKEGEDSRAPDTAYFIEVNTVDKHISIQTNKNDGEEFSYLFQINTGGSTVTMCDSAGNYFQMNSVKQSLILHNQAESEIGIEQKRAWIKAADQIDIETNKLNIKSQTTNINSTNEFSLKTNSYKATGASYTHNGINIGSTHYHIGNLGKPTSTPK